MAEITLSDALTNALSEFETMNARAVELNDEAARIEAERTQLHGQITDQAIFVETLQNAIRRYGGSVPTPTAAPGPTDPMNEHLWQSLKRTAAIVLALRTVGKPLGPKNLTLFLNSRGRHDDVGAVSATLGHLQTSGRVRSLGHGQWVVGHQEADLAEEMDASTYNAISDAATFDEIIRGGVHPEGAPGQ